MNKGRRAMDRAPIMSRITSAYLNWRAVLRRDPDLKEDVFMAACIVMALIGVYLRFKFP